MPIGDQKQGAVALVGDRGNEAFELVKEKLHNVVVAVEVDADRFVEFFLDGLFS